LLLLLLLVGGGGAAAGRCCCRCCWSVVVVLLNVYSQRLNEEKFVRFTESNLLRDEKTHPSIMTF
jgi:hypothetical protein